MLEEKSMEEYFDEAGSDLSERESRVVRALIRRILQYDPRKRPAPEAILAYPWFAEDGLRASLPVESSLPVG